MVREGENLAQEKDANLQTPDRLSQDENRNGGSCTVKLVFMEIEREYGLVLISNSGKYQIGTVSQK